MTIRHHCEQCGQLLKIKDELAGTPNKCPACKHPFIVPTAPPSDGSHAEAPPAARPESAQSTASGTVVEQVAAPSGKADVPAPPAVPRVEEVRKVGDDFDPVAFLMENETPSRSGTRGTPGGSERDSATPPPSRNKWRSRTAEIPDQDPHREVDGPRGGELKGGAQKPEKGAASANARDILEKAIKDARGKPEHMPSDADGEPSGEPDVRAMIREIGGAKLGLILGIIVLSGAFYWWVSQPRLEVPPRGYVSGRVTLDGQPLAGAIVNFLPLEKKYRKDKSSKTAIGIHAASGVTDADGHYTLFYAGSYKGTFVGKNFVYLSPMMSEEGLDRIPASWSPSSLGFTDQVKTVDVTEGSNPNFDIDMKSNPMK